MAYIVRVAKYVPSRAAWDAYAGAYEISTMELKGPPEQVMPTSIVDKILELYTQQFALHGETLQYIRISVDTSPTLYTKYEVVTYSHDLAQVALIAIAALVGLLLLAVIGWEITSAIKTVTGITHPLVWNIGIIAVIAIILMLAYLYWKSGKGIGGLT